MKKGTRRDFLRTSACALGGLAMASSIESFGVVSALTPQSATDYRALVCIFLNGGNDGNNMIVSLDQYSQYNAARGAAGLAIPQQSLLAVSPATGGSYGFHPNMPEMRDLFNLGKLAVVSNVGPLIEPLTRTTYRNGTGKRPVQLFSHSDQVNLWQSSIATGQSQTGWGGRVADLSASLNAAATFPQVISIAGISLFVTATDTRPLAINDSNTPLSSVLPLSMSGPSSEVAARRTSFDFLRTLELGNQLVKSDSGTRSSSLQTKAFLDAAPPRDFATMPNTTLGRQLEQVARVIALRDGLGMKRQIFFCSLGGFDTHADQRGNGQDALLQQVSQAMKGFYDATVEMGVQNNVTAFTLSDFGRTLQPAGSGGGVGSDHAWGNHQFVMGGSVLGGSLYGAFPTIALGGPDDTDGGSNPRGRWIPTTAVEQYAATLAVWYGLSSSDLSIAFPLIGRFSPTTMGFVA